MAGKYEVKTYCNEKQRFDLILIMVFFAFLFYLKSHLFSSFNHVSHIIICSQGTGEVTCWKYAVLLIVNLFPNISVNSKFLYLPNTCYIYAAMINMVNQN